MEKVTKGKVLSNLDQVFFDLPAAAGTPPGLSSGSQPYWGGVKNGSNGPEAKLVVRRTDAHGSRRPKS